jgi:Protein of unknown function (DUF4232)
VIAGRRFVGVAVLYGALTSVASAFGGAAVGAPRCVDSGLGIRVIRAGAALGNIGGYIGFTNRTGRTCKLSGWPTVVAVTAGGATTTARRVRTTMFGPYRTRGVPVVTLRPGERADAVFAGSDIPGPGKTECPPPYRHLRVTPPGGSRHVVISGWVRGLNAFMPSCSGILVTMVVPASALHRG